MTTIPPITDHLPVALRCYATPTWRDLPDPSAPPRKLSRMALAGASPWTLIFDCETTNHPGQALRFGAYQLRNAAELVESGLFYEPEGVDDDELETLIRYAGAHGLKLRNRQEFVDDVFFGRAWQLRATIVGFNLPFDISRLAIAHGTARTPLDNETGGMRGAFTFRLSDQKIYPNIRIRHMSRTAASISFAATMRQPDGRGHRNRGLHTPTRRGHFVDVKTIATALFARSFTLASLSKFLRVPHPKLEFDDFAGPITDDMVRYAVRDVQATWECYAELIARFGRLKLTRTLPEKIYSEAGIGKGYLKEMSIAPWRDVQPDVPAPLIAKMLGSYFGGRSEVRIRREIRQVILCDFLSMYPTVCTLMGLWRFATGAGMTWRDSTVETRAFLNAVDLVALQSPATWRELTTLVQVAPDTDIFPVRADYADEGTPTIGANYLSSNDLLWFTLADCIAAKLLTGKAPKIVEALTFTPGAVQPGLRPVDIAGNPEYRVDPNTTDFFKRVIELRQSIKARMKDATGAEHERLDTEQNALKICANSTSYGIWIEVNVADQPRRRSLTVLSTTAPPRSFPSLKTEAPGRYFHPLLGTLITGAARLMLAITERLLTDKGLEWAFCDTDSMAIARSDDMAPDALSKHTADIVEWFAALNPYDFGGSILKVEDVNASLETGQPEALYCFAISSKRYALFNLSPDGTPILRKVSAHGLGHLRPPYGEDDAAAHLPVPDRSVLRDGTARWHCDLWHHIIVAALGGKPDRVCLDYHPALGKPAVSQYSATSPELLRWFKRYNASRSYRDQVKPFNFLLSLTAASTPGAETIITAPKRGRPKKRSKLAPVAPFDRDHGKALALGFDRNTGEPVPPSALKSYAEALARYHLSPESKFLNGNFLDRGMTVRRHVRMTGTLHIGKESHDWERQATLGLNLDSEVSYGRTGHSPGGETPDDNEAQLRELRSAVACDGLRATARRLGVDPANLRRKLTRDTRG